MVPKRTTTNLRVNALLLLLMRLLLDRWEWLWWCGVPFVQMDGVPTFNSIFVAWGQERSLSNQQNPPIFLWRRESYRHK